MSEQIEERDDEEVVESQEAQEAELVEPPQEPEIPDEVIAEAKKYGWKPKDEYTLEPKGWVDADRFLELPSTTHKMLRDTQKEFDSFKREKSAEVERVSATARAALDRVRMEERTRYEQQLNAIEGQKRQAAEVGDMDRYDQLSEQQQKIPVPTQQEQPQTPPEMVEAETYVQSAKWAADPYAREYARKLIDANADIQNLPPMKQIKWAEDSVRKHFPEHFEDPTPKPAPKQAKVDSGGLGFKRGRGAESLPADALKVGNEFVADGLYKSLDDYAKDYFSQD